MSRRSTPLLCAALAALLVAFPVHAQLPPATAPVAVGVDPTRLDLLGEVLDGYVADGRLPGGVVLVARKGKLVYHRPFGMRDREAGDPMAGDDLFRIASQSKAVVSVAALILVEEGRLLLSDRVGRFLPEFQETTVAVPQEGGGYQVVPAARPITLRDLLTHTAGVGYGSGPGGDRWEAAGITGWYFGHREEPIRETVRRMADLPFQAHPGEAFVYGYSTDILGALVEAVAGVPLDRFLRERILDPLGMDDTHFYLPLEKAGRLTTVYSHTAEGALVRAPDGPGMTTQGEYLDGPRRSLSGGAGLVSTAGDYARFLQMLLNGGELDGVRILSPASVELMTADHVGPLVEGAPGWEGHGFGLGFQVTEELGPTGAHGSVGEYGWGGAYHSTYWVDPARELVVVYLTQVIPARVDDHARVRALVYGAPTR